MAPLAEDVLRNFSKAHDDDVTMAHNLDFDVRMLRQSGLELLMTKDRADTLRVARHLYPDFPSHSNQALRYRLDVKPIEVPGAVPHRALPDIMVTYGIFEHMLNKMGLDAMLALTKKVPLQRLCRLPAHKGKPWSEVPTDYMRWILNKTTNPFSEEIRATCEHHLNERTRGRLASAAAPTRAAPSASR